MKPVMKNFLIAFSLFFCIVAIGTCTMRESAKEKQTSPVLDSVLKAWRTEKAVEQLKHEKQLTRLQAGKDSLQTILKEKKKALSAYKFQASLLEDQLREVLTRVDSSHVWKDSLAPMADDYFTAELKEDSTCNETIQSLESIAANRDSAIVIYKQNEYSFREIQRQQELQNQLLTEQLNTAYKQQRRKVIQNKFLAGGLIFISGLTTTLLLNQTLK
ncbi:MAG: hypothetical protein ACJ77K_08120 [Bacteroidia bacterium]